MTDTRIERKIGMMEGVIESIDGVDYSLIIKAIMENSQDGLFVTDHLGNVVMVNRASVEMHGITTEEVLGKNVKDLIEKKLWNRSAALEVLKQNKTVTLISVDTEEKKVLSTAIPVFDESGVLKFVLVNDRDIRFLKEMTAVLEDENHPYRKNRFELSEKELATSELQNIVIESPIMKEVIYFAIKAARFDLPLVVTGDTGVGKNQIVQMIHSLSKRKNGPFVIVNCATIAGSLLESELFGYEKGAFTGAKSEGKAGMFELAHNGTLFLDEIAEIPLSLQQKLLRFIESGEMMRVGGLKQMKINTRIIAATHQDLSFMVDQGRFRKDLYFRLNVIPIEIPSLESRKEEIVPLSNFFVDRFNKKYTKSKQFSNAALKALQSYSFPGNIRELENLVQRLVTMTDTDLIDVADLPIEMSEYQNNHSSTLSENQNSFKGELDRFEQDTLLRAVKEHGSQRKAAEALGISQSTISRKLGKQKE